MANDVPDSCSFMTVGSGNDAAIYLWPGFNDKGNPILDCELDSTTPDAIHKSSGNSSNL